MISKLKKLKGRSLAELADRGRQKVGAIAERAGLSDASVFSDVDFFASLDCDAATGQELLDHFRSRGRNYFFPSFSDRNETVEVLNERFPDERERLIVQAKKICAGRFDLLGFSDLEFGGPMPDWHLEPISAKRSPLVHRSAISEIESSESGDKKIVWELNRHQYLIVLGTAYWVTEDERYANTALAHIVDWIDKNPPKLGVNWVSSLEIAYRSISWIWAIKFFLESPSMSGEVLLRMLKCLSISGRHIENNLSTFTSPNTHLTGEALGLFALGSFLPELKDAARWRDKGIEILDGEIDKQVRADGGYAEQSTQYQRYTADIYLTYFILRRGQDGAYTVPKRLERLLEYLIYMAQPDGRTPLIGDDDGGRLHFLDGRPFDDFRSTLAVGAALLQSRELKFTAGESSPEMLWLLGRQGIEDFDAIEPIAPADTARAFKQSGFYSIRNSWKKDASFLLIDCGPHGFLNGGHAHADALGVIVSVNGVPVFVDSGTYNYTSDPEARELFRSTAAHNCLTVDGKSSSVTAGPFAWKTKAEAKVVEWKSDSASTIFRGEHDGFARLGVGYEREIRFAADRVTEIVDRIRTKDVHSFEVNFILSPDVVVDSCGEKKVFLKTKDGKRDLLRINTMLAECLECGWRAEPAKISPRYGALVETTKLVFKVVSDRDLEIINRITPARV